MFKLSPGADIPDNYLAVFFCSSSKKSSSIFRKSNCANFWIYTKYWIVELQELLLVPVSIFGVACHDEQITTRKGDEILLQIDEYVVSFIKSISTDYAVRFQRYFILRFWVRLFTVYCFLYFLILAVELHFIKILSLGKNILQPILDLFCC